MIIVTGSKGFIGQHFVNYIQKCKNNPRPETYRYNCNVLGIDEDNCWDFLENYGAWSSVELIIHQGAISSTTETDVDKLHQMNVKFTIELFKKAIVNMIPIKFASSASVYGHLNKENLVNPLNYYAITKLQTDYWIQDHMDEFNSYNQAGKLFDTDHPSIQSFRYFNVYGDGEDHKGDQSSPVSKFTKQIKETGKLKLFKGSDRYLRDFICVDDVVDIVLNNDKPSGIYDLGTSNPTSFQEVGELVAKKYNGTIEYIPFPEHLEGKYQEYTSAKKEWGDYKFTTVEEYLQR